MMNDDDDDPGYFHAGFALELSLRLKMATSTVSCPAIFELLKVNRLLFLFCAEGDWRL